MAEKNKNGWWEKQTALLFVDDELNILKSLGRTFRNAGYNLFFAESGKQALEILEHNDIDLLMTDQKMPEMLGTELLKIVKNRWPHIVRLMLSGYTDPDSLLAAINQGEVYRFIRKPWDDESFKKIVAISVDNGKVLKGFAKLVEKLREEIPNHTVETKTDIEKGELSASLEDREKKMNREQMALLIPVLLDNINEQFAEIDAEKLGMLIAKRMGKINFTAEIGAGARLCVEIPTEEKDVF